MRKTHNYSHNECSQWNLAPGQILIPGHEGKTDFFLQMIANKSSEAVVLAKKFLHLLIFCSLPRASNTKIEFNGGWNHFFSHYFTSTYFTGLSWKWIHYIHCIKTLISELQKIKTTRYHTIIDTSPKFQIPYFCVTSESSQQYGVSFTGNIDFMRFYLIQHPKLSFPLETSWTLWRVLPIRFGGYSGLKLWNCYYVLKTIRLSETSGDM